MKQYVQTIDCSIMFETHHTAQIGSSEMRFNYAHESTVIQHSTPAKTEE